MWATEIIEKPELVGRKLFYPFPKFDVLKQSHLKNILLFDYCATISENFYRFV